MVGLLAAIVLIAGVFALSGGRPDDTELANGQTDTPDPTDQSGPGQVVPADPKVSVEPFKDTGSEEGPEPATSGDSDGEEATREAETARDSTDEPAGPSKTKGTDVESAASGDSPVTPTAEKPPEAPVVVKPAIPTPAPLPSAEEQENAAQLVREIFDKEIDGATTARTRIAVARRMLEAAGDADKKATTRFVLLVEAHKLAIMGEDTALVGEITDCMVRDFTIDASEANASILDTKAIMLEQLRDRAETPEDLAAVAEGAIALAEQAAADDKADLAEKMARMALAAARKTGDDDLVRKATLRLVELR